MSQYIRARRFGSRGWIAYSRTGRGTRPMQSLGLAILAARLLP
jgi:hypothetical protein